MTGKIIMAIASVSGAIAVALGAFGAHKFKAFLTETNRIDVYETAVKYHFIHTLLLLFTGYLLTQEVTNSTLNYSAICNIVGILIFSGSLYILTLTNTPKLGMITPIGGLFLIVAWVLLAVNFFKG